MQHKNLTLNVSSRFDIVWVPGDVVIGSTGGRVRGVQRRLGARQVAAEIVGLKDVSEHGMNGA